MSHHERPRLLLIAATTGYQIRVFADAARRLGLDLELATDRCHILEDPWADHAIPVRFEDPYGAAALLAEEHRLRPFKAVVPVGDRPCLLAAMAAERAGIPHNSPASVAACRDKHLARQRFEAAGLRTPRYFRVEISANPREAAARAPFPCVLKPLGLSGSRGVVRTDNPAEFAAAFERIKALLELPEVRILREPQHRYLQVESFIPGSEFALEGILTDGRLHVLALFDKPDPLDGPCFEETIYVTPARVSKAVREALISTTQEAVRALGLHSGPIHAEMRFNSEGVWMLEVAARSIGGLCTKALRFRLDGQPGFVPLEELILLNALGRDVRDVQPADPASGAMMIPIPREGIYENVRGVERAQAIPGVTEVAITARPGQKLLTLPEGASYLGFIFARGHSPDAVERALREAHTQLRFEISPILPVLAT
ncbi:MAG: ATP-grasp domain-containing protein [Bryobacteraceae bacterium]